MPMGSGRHVCWLWTEYARLPSRKQRGADAEPIADKNSLPTIKEQDRPTTAISSLVPRALGLDHGRQGRSTTCRVAGIRY